MSDRRSFLKAAGLGALAVSAGAGVAGCSQPTRPSTPAAPTTVPKADVPVGGGMIMADGPYVVTQPASGQFKAFSKACTHQGCPVTEIAGDAIVCRCHGARFSTADGHVLNGPATKPLPEAKATVQGDRVVISRA
ncbi:Rieske (2Fe-2S) protein [Nigerium massiliense]|uniref:Rieske (2Fe-2S) protein n=1 Tax=Nigerium massiliense TaxID=1522317 RepID=UPI00059036A7|nr:Rieske (2Fe-2S) protein [Nigerium massiliense]